MASDIESKLSRLRARRKGEPGVAVFSESRSGHSGYAQDAAEIEDWEKRGASSQKWTRYAIGSMQAVGKKYTEVSIETGNRVANQLKCRLDARGISTEFKLQGSVPLDVHIKGVSDVDVLALREDFFTYSNFGSRAQRGYYQNPTQLTSKEVLKALRLGVEYDLKNAFPAASVDTNGGKAVKISGGSLPRSVDVVPSHWHDNESYQLSGREEDRGVTIYDKKADETVKNLPFLHIERVGNRCDSIGGGLRKAIRLCKNVKSDSDRTIQLSSYDIAAIMYHSDMSALSYGRYTDLAVLAETQRHLDYLYRNQSVAEQLIVPDGSRRIFNSPEKFQWLLALSVEMDELLTRVFAESYPNYLGNEITVQRDFVKSLSI